MMRLLKNPWLAAALGLVVYLATTAAVLLAHRDQLKPAEGDAAQVPKLTPSWEFHNPEIDQLIEELRSEKKDLETRKASLEDLAVRLRAERLEIDQVVVRVQQLQQQFDQTLLRVTAEEAGQLKRLARTYAAMTPDSTAKVFKSMDDRAVARIMVFMKEAETAPIFESMTKLGETEAKRVGELSEQLRRVIQEAGAKGR